MEIKEVEEALARAYSMYQFDKNGYKSDEKGNYQPFDNAMVNRFNDIALFYICDSDIARNSRPSSFVDGKFLNSRLNLKNQSNIFINVNFENTVFTSCGFNKTLFINCLLENTIFDTCSMEGICFVNCEFKNCEVNEPVKKAIFINCNVEEFKDSDTHNSLINEDSSNSVLIDRTLFGLFEINNSDVQQISIHEDDDIIHEVEIYSRENIDFNKSYINCIFKNINFDKNTNVESATMSGCKFIDCNFDHCNFRNTILDTSVFENCKFIEVKFNRSSFIKTKFDAGCTFGITFIMCNTFDMEIKCDPDYACFEKTYNPTDLNDDVEDGKVAMLTSTETIINNLNDVIEALTNEDYINSLQKEQEITENDVISFFSTKTLEQSMTLITKIMNSLNGKKGDEI